MHQVLKNLILIGLHTYKTIRNFKKHIGFFIFESLIPYVKDFVSRCISKNDFSKYLSYPTNINKNEHQYISSLENGYMGIYNNNLLDKFTIVFNEEIDYIKKNYWKIYKNKKKLIWSNINFTPSL